MKHSKVTFNLDLGDIFSDISIPIKKTAKVLNIILMENGQPYEIEKDCKVVFYAKKPNGDVLYNDCIVRDNVVEYQLTTQTIALAGIVECELLVYGEDSSTPIHSPSFTLVNYEPVFDGGEAIESTNEFTALTQAMGTLETLIDQAEDVINSKSDDYTIHVPNYLTSKTSPLGIEFGTHVCAVTEFDSTLPESDEEYTVQGTLEVIKAFDSIDSIRMYWYPCGSHNVYSRLPITDQNWSEWETAQSGGGGVSESVVNEKVATSKRELIGGADDLTDADTIHAAKNLARGLVNGLENKVVKTTELNNAINTALSQAKASGEFDGADGKDGAAGADGQDGANGLSAYQIWLQQGNTGSEADFLESLKGADGASGKDGADGSNGEDGKDGTSVTVSSVTESTADGGENIVTFSNGQTLKVKNGSKGSKGDAYTLTAADKAEIVASVIETLGGNPIFGYVDENNNIVVQGNLSDGTYSVKYEMEDGSTVNIGNLVLDTNVYYSVTKNLTNCNINNSTTTVIEGESYSAKITANDGYELSSVVVTMGGTDITSSAVSGGTISIASVTGNIVITAVAEEAVVEPTNLLPKAIFTEEDGVSSNNGYVSGYKLSNGSGGLSAVSGCYASGYMLVGVDDTVTIENITLRTDGNTNNILLFSDTNKASKIVGKPGPTGAFDSGVTVNNGVYSFTPRALGAGTNVAYFRFSCGGITDETIVKVTKA